MVSIVEFCERLVGDFANYFRSKQSLRLLTQSSASCKAIIKRCIEFEPDYVLDIGTNYGMSALSLAYAMRVLGGDLSRITTTDIDQSHWRLETPKVQRGLLLNCGIDVLSIGAVQEDFMTLDPSRLIRDGRVLVFYDIHGTDSRPFMDRFIDLWIPHLSGAVMVHDFYSPHSGYWIDRDNLDCPVSTAEHYSGQVFEGYRECRVLIDWMNASRKPLRMLEGTQIVEFQL